MAEPPMPDLSHLSAEERQIIEEVFQRQRAEEEKETQISQKADQELQQIERQINEYKENAKRLVGTQDDAICQICQKTKFADGIGHKCFYCQLRSCARCGGRTTQKNKPIWACSLCQRRQQILAKTGKWFRQATPEGTRATSPADVSPTSSAPRTPQTGRSLASSITPNVTTTAQSTLGVTTTQRSAQHGTFSLAVQPSSSNVRSVSPSHKVTSQRRQSIIEIRPAPVVRQPSLEPTDSRHGNVPIAKQLSNGGPNQIVPPIMARSSSVRGETQRSSSVQKMPSHDHQCVDAGRSAAENIQDTAHRGQVEKEARTRILQEPQPCRQVSGVTSLEENSIRREVLLDEREARKRLIRSVDSGREHDDQRNVEQRDDYEEMSEKRRISDDHPRQRLREPTVARSDRHERGFASTSAQDRGHTERSPSPPYENVDRTSRGTAMSAPRSASRNVELRRSRSIRDNEMRKSENMVNAVPPVNPASSVSHYNRMKKSRLTRQYRSMSSSEDEVEATTSSGHRAMPSENVLPRGDRDICSETEILRYIYGSNKVRNGRKSWSDSSHRFMRDSEVTNVPSSTSTILPGDLLAAKIRTYLSHPVTWQPSADQRRLIGHMILHKTDGTMSGDLGLKVVGGRRSDTGRLGAFITRVKPGSVADNVGRLRPGDEVLEWNGRPLQNATFDQVYEVINSSRHSSHVELIVSRSMCVPGSDDFLNVQRLLPNPSYFAQSPYSGEMNVSAPPALEPMLSHSQSATISPQVAPSFNVPHIMTSLARPESTTSMYTTGQSVPYPYEASVYDGPYAKGQIFGRIEISLLYSMSDRQLVVTIYRALDLSPRPDGTLRNPYVKLFLLPDRSERSRRQSAVLAETCKPVWNEPFYYHGLTEPMLMERVLEVTVWDYDKYETNAFLGEVLIDFSVTKLDDEPLLYTLVDMDVENPLRARLRHRRMNIHCAPSGRLRNELSHSPSSYFQTEMDIPNSIDYGGYGCVPDPRQQLMESSRTRQSRTYDRTGGTIRYEEDWTMSNPSGYLSDHGYSTQLPIRYRHRERRPRSAMAMRPPISDADRFPAHAYNRNLPPPPWNDDGDDSSGANIAPPPPAINARGLHDVRRLNGRLRTETLHDQYGYGSDGSETLSIRSVQSVPSRRMNQHVANGDADQPQMSTSVEDNADEFAEDGASSDSVLPKGSTVNMKDRKKSIMTRLIPGRNMPIEAKRTGFARSEEVGVPEGLSFPSDHLLQSSFAKQASRDSSESHGDGIGPVLPEGPLGAFVENLGPGQVVGRQVLASPVLGEIQVGIAVGRNGIDVEIIRAKNLVVKPGIKANPAPYVKVYLMEGKHCVAKAKTNTVRKTTAPVYQQHLIFSESPHRKMLQITVLGDYGRMERKAFMGIALIRLDDIELGPEPSVGWYKLFHSSSLVGTAPTRRDSANSLPELTR
ncbi:hypothetical protein AB6A40_001217 [Gnathostoma spinigerum]|uniref:Rab-3-interacting molecule unc-10 n=1 Tax=Gnathostoma spinigerum TaxID=75299 RepID=A0ABD6E3U5_9BILA